MAANQGKGKGFFRGLLSGSSSRPTLLRGDPHERGVAGYARRARQEQAARHSQAQSSTTLEQVRSRFQSQSSLHSHTVRKSLSVRMSLPVILLIGRSSEAMPVSLGLEGIARLALLITQEPARLRMRLQGGGAAQSPRTWTG